MIQTVSVLASGPAFSFLLYENLKSEFGQDGFLLGDIIERETKNITDNEQQQTYLTSIINVNGVVPCPHNHYFFNGAGKIDRAKLKSLLGNQQSKVVAWYRYKPASPFKLSLREKLIHKQLAEFFNVHIDLFTICLPIAESTTNCSTHSFQQTFLRFKNNRFESLPFHILNLMDKKDCYKNAEPSAKSFQKIIDKIKDNPETSDAVVFITKLHEAIQTHVESLVKKLTFEEERLCKLEEEVHQMIQIEKRNKKIKVKEEHTKENVFDSIATNNAESSTILDESVKRGKGKRRK